MGIIILHSINYIVNYYECYILLIIMSVMILIIFNNMVEIVLIIGYHTYIYLYYVNVGLIS